MGGAGDPGDARDMAQPGNWPAVRKNRRAGALPVRRRRGLRSEKHALSQITNHPRRNKNAPGVIFLYAGEISPKFGSVARSNASTKNMQTISNTSASFEIVFGNGGGASLQSHDGSVAIFYNDCDMSRLAHDVQELDKGSEPSTWDGNEPEHFVSDEEYNKHAPNGGYYALQLDLDYRSNWPDAEETSWNNVANFLRAFSN